MSIHFSISTSFNPEYDSIDELKSSYPIVGYCPTTGEHLYCGSSISKDEIEFIQEKKTLIQNIEYTIMSNSKGRSIVVGNEKFDKKYLKKIKKYCPCVVCTGWLFQKYYICSCCVGCLKSSRNNYQNIIKAIKKYENRVNNPVKPY